MQLLMNCSLSGGFKFVFSYYIQHCFICCPSDSTVPTDARIEPRTVATGALALTTRLDLIRSLSDLFARHYISFWCTLTNMHAIQINPLKEHPKTNMSGLASNPGLRCTLSVIWTPFYALYSGCCKRNSLWPLSLSSGSYREAWECLKYHRGILITLITGIYHV